MKLPVEERNREIARRIEKPPKIEGDPGPLRLVSTNLRRSAAKFNRLWRPVVIEAGDSGTSEALVLLARDKGVGFHPKCADRLFGVFQRLHCREDFESTGIGLASVQRIIRRHGAENRAEAALERGAIFSFTVHALPLQIGPEGAKEMDIG
ncbi:MAG: ATP-binding protein [Candidatus Acidiferrales bacterium]